uniref:Putative secreted protein n=1 Tax=Ixodes ricinus TaxID=34613 RepID=V5H039_IXORI
MSSVQMDICNWLLLNLFLLCSQDLLCELSDTQSDATHSAGVITPAFHTVEYPRTKPGVPLGCRYFHSLSDIR